jgi:hypothetical protein
MTSVATCQQSRQFHWTQTWYLVVLTLLTLKVKVEMAMGTLIAFHPKNLHGQPVFAVLTPV